MNARYNLVLWLCLIVLPAIQSQGDIAAYRSASAKAVQWLSQQQKVDGSWGNDEAIKPLYTSEAVIALRALNERNAAYYWGITWLENHQAGNADYRIRRILALAPHGDSLVAEQDYFYWVQYQRSETPRGNFGFGLSEFYDGSPLETALALQADAVGLNLGYNTPGALDYLKSTQLTGADNGWALAQEPTSDPITTGQVIQALLLYTDFTYSNYNPAPLIAVIDNAVATLTANVNATTEPLVTAHAALALLRQDKPLDFDAWLMMNWLLADQSPDGSWHQDEYVTAVAIRALAAALGSDAPALSAAVYIPDANLRAAINVELGRNRADAITLGEMAKLTSLVAVGQGIDDLTGLETAVNLSFADLQNNAISDFSPLVGLRQLRGVLINGNNFNMETDSDRDGMPDAWEVESSLNVVVRDGGKDNDGDGYTNIEEYYGNSDPTARNSFPGFQGPIRIGESDIRVNASSVPVPTFSRPEMSSDNNGNIYIVWFDLRNGYEDVFFNYSNDYGVTWANDDIRLDTNSPGSRPSEYAKICSDESGNVYVVWEESVSLNPYDSRPHIYFNCSHDYGATWMSSDVRIDQSVPDSEDALSPEISCDDNGNIYVVWSDTRNGVHTDIYFNSSNDYGFTWQATDIRLDTNSPGAAASDSPSISNDDNGNVYVTWNDARTSYVDVYFNRSSDYGLTWQMSDTRIDTDAPTYAFFTSPEVSNDNNGNVYVVWNDERADNIYRSYFNYSNDYGATWQANDIHLGNSIPVGSTSGDGVISADDSGRMYAAWRDDREGYDNCYFNYSSDSGASWELPGDNQLNKNIVPVLPNTGSPEIANDDFGNIYAVWVDDRNGERGVYLNYSNNFGVTWRPVDIRLDTGERSVRKPWMLQIRCDQVENVYVTWRNGVLEEESDIYFNYLKPVYVYFPDASLRSVINASAARSEEAPMTYNQLSTLTTLNAAGLGITDLTGLEAAINLVFADLRNNNISDISMLAGLENLDQILLQGNNLSWDVDTDEDGMPDGWEANFGLNPLKNDAGLDSDGDGYANIDEYYGGGHPNNNTSLPIYPRPLGVGGTDIRLDTDAPGLKYSYRPEIAGDNNGNLYVVWYDARNGNYDIYFNCSNDSGATWRANDIRLDTDAAGSKASYYPKISCDGYGNVYVVWYDARNGSNDIYSNYSNDYGTTWRPTDVRLDTNALGSAHSYYPEVRSDNHGDVYVVWYDGRNGSNDIYCNYSNDYGATWQSADIRLDSDLPGAKTSSDPQIRSDEFGNVYVVWYDSRNGSYDIYFNHSNDYGATWQLDVSRKG